MSATSDVSYWDNQRCRHGRTADLNWKQKISDTAYNADITQSQARDTRHRRMQEVNSLCTNSGPLRPEYCILAYHTIQPSSLNCPISQKATHTLLNSSLSCRCNQLRKFWQSIEKFRLGERPISLYRRRL